VIPRSAGGEITPEGLVAVGRVAREFNLYTKITGSQRIGLFRAIAEAAGNRLMLGLFDAIDAVRRDPAWQHLREMARTPERVDVYNDHHHKIITAIIHRQPNEAAAAMREHLLSLQTALIQAINLEDAPLL
jgi:DNA-binding FadR family transcriptional regulator